MTDANGNTTTGTIVVDIIDDVPTANADTNSVTEGAIVGNVLTDGDDERFGGADGRRGRLRAGGVSVSRRAATRRCRCPVSAWHCRQLRRADAERGRHLQLRRQSERGSACGRDGHVRVHDHGRRRRPVDDDADDHPSTTSVWRRPTTGGERGCAGDGQQPGEHGGDGDRHPTTSLAAPVRTPSRWRTGAGTHGTLTFNADGSYSYTLTSTVDGATSNNGITTENNVETFTYQVTDANGNTTTNTITIDVTDDVPTANPNTNSATEGAIVGQRADRMGRRACSAADGRRRRFRPAA